MTVGRVTTSRLVTRRLLLRPLVSTDWERWAEVRNSCRDWLEPWEPHRPAGALDPAIDPGAFASRCSSRERDRQLGNGYAFGVFLHDGTLLGEVNVNNVIRSAFMCGDIGYWIDRRHAGQGYTPEAVVGVLRFVFEAVRLHRIQIAIIPRNTASRRVVEKLGIRQEGLSERFLLINGVWEDHLRFAITAEEWEVRRAELTATYLRPESG